MEAVASLSSGHALCFRGPFFFVHMFIPIVYLVEIYICPENLVQAGFFREQARHAVFCIVKVKCSVIH
jgi:hypothetical protein